MLRRFLKDYRGATAVEYGLIIAVLSLVIVAGVGKFSNELQNVFGDNNRTLQGALDP